MPSPSRLSAMAASSAASFLGSPHVSPLTKKTLAALAASASTSTSSRCCSCRCLIDNRTRFRAWALLKYATNNGPRTTAWMHSSSDESFLASADDGTSSSEKKCEDGDDNPGSVVSEKKPLRLNRRLKGSFHSSGIPSNPDLLAIPGVGLRNLRKLERKGIAGVVELKKLYKDKVYWL